MYYIYMLRCSDNSLYTGITNDFEKRYAKHASKTKTAAKYTKSHTVICVEALWSCEDKSDALRLERRIKALPKPKKEKLLQSPQSVSELGLSADYAIVDKTDFSNPEE